MHGMHAPMVAPMGAWPHSGCFHIMTLCTSLQELRCRSGLPEASGHQMPLYSVACCILGRLT
jgi:hypothetical protein